jgi:hypothetical protein
MRELAPPSTAPCSPAPSRCLVIIRTDNQGLHQSSLTSFDKLLSQSLMSQTSPYQKNSSALSTMPDPDTPQHGGMKKRWSLLKNILPFGTPGNDRPGEVTPPQTPEEGHRTPHGHQGSRPATPPHQVYSFKFSLEWTDRSQSPATKGRRLATPSLPFGAQQVLDSKRSQEDGSRARHDKPVKPTGESASRARYSGRALSEWAQVLMECRNFYVRRRQEGVPRDDLVETPTMGVETFRMMG